jgi:hypothetical protein
MKFVRMENGRKKRMNSKELLEQAEARVKRINELSDDLSVADDVLAMLGEGGEICFFFSGIGTTHLTPVLSQEKMQKLREEVVLEIINSRDDRTAELEQLLGIQPVPTYQDALKSIDDLHGQFPAPATQGTLDEIGKQMEADRIDKPTEKFEVGSITAEDKPGPVNKSSTYPEGMTYKTVKKMYIEDGMTINAIAKYFKIPYAKAANFIGSNKLHRTHMPEKSSKLKTDPEETERP